MQLSDRVRKVSDEILRRFGPQEMILYNLKRDVSGDVSSFKICVVAPTQDKFETEKQIYLGIDSEVPFDVLIYTPEEWRMLRDEKGSFAYRIIRKGQYIYGEEK